MTITIEPQLLERSKEIALGICRESSNMEDMPFLQYHVRRPSFEGLVTAAGYTEFHPRVHVDVTEKFNELFEEVIRRQQDKYLAAETDEEAELHHKMWNLAKRFQSNLRNEDILNGVIPITIQNYIDNRGLKGFSSPKLSRALAKLASEGSKFWAWYTNKCPKKVTFGENEDYKLVVSTLPHHMAGMSYYSCYNYDGKPWNGWNGTSCQDPRRNSGGGAMRQLPASVKDETLAVAYLTKSKNDDIMNPIYEARTLIRVVEFSNGNVAYVVLRQFGYTESIAIMNEGLKNQYPNIILNEDIREKYSNNQGKCIRIHMDIADMRYAHVYEGSECNSCDGEPENYEGDGQDCTRCGGTGKHIEYYYPYNDDSDIWTVNADDKAGKRITYRIPKQLLIDRGIYGEAATSVSSEEDEAA